MLSSDLIAQSEPAGIVWPGLPPVGDGLLLALLFQFEHSQWWPAPRLLEHQLRQLAALVAHAAATSPFYAGRLGGLEAGGKLSLEAFRRVPVLTREDLQAHGPELVSRAPPADHGATGEVRSSGSTGRPVSVKATSVTRLYLSAHNMRFHIWHRRDLNQKVAALLTLATPRLIEASRTGAGTPWATGYESGPMVYFDVTRPVPEQLDWLVRQDAAYVLTHPTNLRALLEESRKAGVMPDRLRDVSVMAEVVDPGLPGLCREVWNVPVHASYSSRETGILALQCGAGGNYHVMAENVLLEIIGDDGAPCRPGETGRVVVTDLHNFIMPLIRYDLGDFAEVGEGCPCGRTLPVLTRIRGRARNMFVLPSGEKFWPVAYRAAALMAIAPVRQIQFVQRSAAEIDVKLVVAEALGPEAERRLRAHFAETLDHPFEFNFVYVDEIPRSPGGKYEDYVCEVSA